MTSAANNRVRKDSVAGRALSLALCCVCMGLLLTTGRPIAADRLDTAAWTVMLYCDADNELEAPEIANVKEMMQFGSTDKVHFVLLCDRSPKSEPKDQYTDEAIGGLPDWHGAKLLHVEKGALKQIADWGDVNIADPATLRRFLAAGAERYPAEHYGLIVMDHGSGWHDFCVDETHGNKTMNLKDLRSGLEEFTKSHGKLEIVGLDACLMGSFETAQALAPVAHWMVGSEELSPNRGWNYDRLTHDLGEKPAMLGYDVGRAIIDAYTIHFRESKDPLAQYEAMGATLSMMDLEKFAPLQNAVTALADSCIASLHHGRDGWIRTAKARIKSEEYGAEGVRGEDHEEEMHDLMGIAVALEKSGDPAIEAAAGQVDDAIRSCIRYAMRSTCTARSGGISIFFPTDGISLRDELGSAYLGTTFSRDSKWVNFLSLYSIAVDACAKEPELKPLKSTGAKASLQNPVEILTKCEDTDIDRAYFLMLAPDQGGTLVIGRMPALVNKDGTIGHRFNGMWFLLSSGEHALTCPITACEVLDNGSNQFLAYVPLRLKRAGAKDWIDVECTFLISPDPQPGGIPIFAFTAGKEGPLQVPFKAGDSILPVYSRIEANGDVTDVIGSEKNALVIKDPKTFMLEWGQVSAGKYKVGFEVVNAAGMMNIVDGDFELE